MPRRTITQISSLIVFLSIITIVIQYVAYYFIAPAFLIIGISAFISIICNHILMEKSKTYYSSFSFTALTLFMSLVITILTYFSRDNSILPYTPILFVIVIINWFVPTLHGFLRNMLEYSSKTAHFREFYRNNNIIFILFYLGIIIYASFLGGTYPWPYPIVSTGPNITPFLSLAILIERYIVDISQINDILIYLASRSLMFIPYGFYITLLLRNNSRILRILSLLAFPLAIEIFQYWIYSFGSDIDDVIYGFIGGIIGYLLFLLTNRIYRAVSGRNFLSRNAGYRYSNLHF